jgi:hypothetical protein
VQNFKFGFNFVCFKMHPAHVAQLLKWLIYVFHSYPATERTDNVFRLGWLTIFVSHVPVILSFLSGKLALFVKINNTNKIVG